MNPPNKSNPYLPSPLASQPAQEAAGRAAKEIYDAERDRPMLGLSETQIVAIILKHCFPAPSPGASGEVREALEACDKVFASWQVGQIPGRPEDILALITKVRRALAQPAPPLPGGTLVDGKVGEAIDAVYEQWQNDWNKVHDARQGGFGTMPKYPVIRDRILAAITPFLAKPDTARLPTKKGERIEHLHIVSWGDRWELIRTPTKDSIPCTVRYRFPAQADAGRDEG